MSVDCRADVKTGLQALDAVDYSALILDVMLPDGDGDVDLLDYADFVACTTGPDIDVVPPCDIHDADEDGDVDHHDFGEFQVAFGIPQ